MGDRLLIEAARRIVSCVREADSVARLGGDEFVVMLSVLSQDRTAALAQADAIAEKIRSALAEPYRLPTGTGHADRQAFIEHRCSASIGVALFDDRDPEEILRVADAAMYRAKQSGANRVCFSEPVAA